MHALRLLTVPAIVVVALLLGAADADADNWGNVDCNLDPHNARCTVEVVNAPSRNANVATNNGPLVCRIGGKVVDCYLDGFGWLGSGGCYYGKDPGGFLQPTVWIKTCYNPTTDDYAQIGTVVLNNPPLVLTAAITRAVANLDLPAPRIASNPGLTAPQVVQVPVWWWVPTASWQPRTATAALPGIALTARATPTTITWDAGDGTSTICTGPGTPWTAAMAPTAPSPTCGHTYQTTSRTSPGGRFTLRATISWTITWNGAGLTGVEPDVTTQATAGIDVTELRAVITG